MAVFWGLVVLGVVYPVTLIAKGGEEKSYEEQALDVLKKRHAPGELTTEEFKKMKNDLKKD